MEVKVWIKYVVVKVLGERERTKPIYRSAIPQTRMWVGKLLSLLRDKWQLRPSFPPWLSKDSYRECKWRRKQPGRYTTRVSGSKCMDFALCSIRAEAIVDPEHRYRYSYMKPTVCPRWIWGKFFVCLQFYSCRVPHCVAVACSAQLRCFLWKFR